MGEYIAHAPNKNFSRDIATIRDIIAYPMAGAAIERINNDGTKEWGMLDAHPAIMEARGVPQGAWPGGCCNQANTAAEKNAVLLQHDGKSAAPAYAWMDGKCRNLFVRLKRPIKAGEEILVDYGYSAHR